MFMTGPEPTGYVYYYRAYGEEYYHPLLGSVSTTSSEFETHDYMNDMDEWADCNVLF